MIILGLQQQKTEMVAALWSNSNWDDDKGSRKKAIEDLEDNYEEAIEFIEKSLKPQPEIEEKKLAEDNPFFAASERGVAWVDEHLKDVIPRKDSDEDEPDYTVGFDQE